MPEVRVLPLDSLLEEPPYYPPGEEAQNRIHMALMRAEVGNEEDFRTPFLERFSRAEGAVFLTQEIGPANWSAFEENDEIERNNMGPLSVIPPYGERDDSVRSYWQQDWDPDDRALNTAVERVAAILPPRSLRPLSYIAASARVPRGGNLGLPELSNRDPFRHDYEERARLLRDVEDVYPCMLFTRGQSSGGPISKARPVWGMDHAETFLGARYMYPALDALRERRGFSAWSGSDAVDVAVSELFARRPSDVKFSMDFSGLDASVHARLISIVFGILSSWFTRGGQDLALQEEIFRTVGIVTPKGIYVGRSGGVPSGSVWTNLVDTLVCRLAFEYVSARFGLGAPLLECMGDDALVIWRPSPTLGDVQGAVSELGLRINTSKTLVSEERAHYLQRVHTLEYNVDGLFRGVRSPYRSLNGMMSLERRRPGWSAAMYSVRWILQVENCRWDPRFPAFVEFLARHDAALSAFRNLDDLPRMAGGVKHVEETLGSTRFSSGGAQLTGWQSFETTSYR